MFFEKPQRSADEPKAYTVVIGRDEKPMIDLSRRADRRSVHGVRLGFVRRWAGDQAREAQRPREAIEGES